MLDLSTKSRSQRCGGEGVKILEKEEEDAKLLARCQAKRKEWSDHWQCNEEIQKMQNKPWRNEELKEGEEALPRLKESDLEKASRLYRAKTGVIPPKSSAGLDKRDERKSCGVSREKRSRVASGRNKLPRPCFS